MVKYLSDKYQPNLYSYNEDDEQSILDYCIIEHISSYLKGLLTNIQ